MRDPPFMMSEPDLEPFSMDSKHIHKRLEIIQLNMKWSDDERDAFFDRLKNEYRTHFEGYKKRTLYSAGDYNEISFKQVLNTIINSMDMRLMLRDEKN